MGYRVLCAGDQYVKEIPKAAIRLSEIKQVVNPTQQYDI
ncbi:hypothetical protein HNR27_002108 [Ornithinibacillus bavariensis]